MQRRARDMELNATQATTSTFRSVPPTALPEVDYCEDFWLTFAIKVPDSADLIRYVHWAFLRPPIDTLGMLGNLALLIVLRKPKFEATTYGYIFWLAVADFGALTFDVLFLLSTVEKYHRNFGYAISWVLCHFLFPIFYTFAAWSAFMVVLLTVHRLQAVRDPFAFRTKSSKTYLVALGALFISLLMNVAGFFQYSIMRVTEGRRGGVEPEVRCYVCTWSAFHLRSEIQDGYVYGREILSRVIPLIAVFSLNVALILIYRHRRAQGRILRSASGEPDKEERRVVYMLMFIGTFYVICMTPMSLYIVAVSTVRKYTTSIDFELFRVAANVLASIQTASNCFLYFFCSRTLRQEFFQICREFLQRARKFCAQAQQYLSLVSTKPLPRSEMITR